MSSIEIKNLSKDYGSTRALDGVDLVLEEGKIYGLLGRNGAGKTTMLNAITGRIFASSGSIELDGAKTLENDAALRQIYMLSEHTYYPEGMKVKKAMQWTATFYPHFDAAYAERLCAAFGLDTGKKVKALSTGYATIFKLILGLATNAPFLLLDEPVLGLDANHRDLFYKTLVEKYETQQAELKAQISALSEKVRTGRQCEEDIAAWIRHIRQYTALETVDEAVLLELIDHVEVGEAYKENGKKHRDVKVFYRYVGAVDDAIATPAKKEAA